MSTEEYIVYCILGFTWIEFLWQSYLDLRQHHIYCRPNALSIPGRGGRQRLMDKRTYDKIRLYEFDKSRFVMITRVYDVFIQTGFILNGRLLFFWIKGGVLVQFLGFSENEPLISAAFVFVKNIFDNLSKFPCIIYYHFLKAKHGKEATVTININNYVVSQVTSMALVCVLVYIVKFGGDFVLLYLYLFVMATTLFLLNIYPDYIAPLLQEFTPLPAGELKTRVKQLADSVNFPLNKIYVVVRSKQSSEINAYFFGFFEKKQIVLYDTLMKHCSIEEVLAVISHELGHWKMNHVLKNIIIMQMSILLFFLGFGYLFKYKEIYRAFWFYNEQPVIVGYQVVMVFVFLPFKAVLSFIHNVLSRRFEFQADAFARSLGKAKYLHKSLIKINKVNLGFPVYDWLYSMWHHSHPPLLERLEALVEAE